MKKFKLIFYPIYIITAFVVIYYSIDILANMGIYKEKMDMTFALRKLPSYLMIAFMFLGILMLVEIVVENLHSYQMKQKLKKAEETVVHYKAQLYDLSQQSSEEQELDSIDDIVEGEDGSD